MTSPSAGSPSEDKFLANYIADPSFQLELMKEQRMPGPGDEALKGEVRNDIIGKVNRGVLKV